MNLGFKELFTDNILFHKLLPQVPNLFSEVNITIPWTIVSIVFGCLFLVSCVALLVFVLVKLFHIKLQLNQKYTILEVKPLRTTEQSAYTTQELFNVVHGLAKQSSWLMRLLGYSKTYSFEIVSTKDQGIRYLMRIPEDDADLLKKNLLSYLPGVRVTEVDDYLSKNVNATQTKVTEFKLANHFAFPLKKQDTLTKHDPIAYTTGAMTKLSESEVVAFQIIASPVTKSSVKDVSRISQLIYSNSDLVKNIKGNNLTSPVITVLKHVLFLTLHLLLLPIGILVFVLSGAKEDPFLHISLGKASKKTDNPYQTELEQLVKEKLDQQLFTTSIRLLIVGTNYAEMRKRERGFISALSSFGNSGYQAIIPSLQIKLKVLQTLKAFLFKHRLLGVFGNPILSVSEVSDIYHLPFTSTTKTEDLRKTHSKELPAPVSLKSAQNLDIVFARNTYGGSTTNIGLSLDERRRHVYILGATGTGKSTMLLSMINQDIQNDKGLCVIDPHGDLIEQILSVIPEERIKDVVYFNPDDIGYPMGINLLELTPGLSAEDTVREKEFIAESIISVFHKIYTDKYSGPRMEYILRNTIHTAFTVPDATLFTVYKLLINTPYRNSVTKNLTDENLKDFWKYEFAKAGDYQKVKMISPITNKIGRFLFSPTAKRILEQGKSTVNFDSILNDGKILLCNLSKGKIGEDNSGVFGVLIMAKIQLAALKRARMKQEDRKDFYLYVDEFQNFATPAFAQILSEARKYRLGAILAHQTTSQLEETSLVNVTLANTGTVICFRTANPEDERMILPQFRPYIEQGEIASLPSYRFYMRLGALNPEEPFSGVTVPVEIVENNKRIQEVIDSSRSTYALQYKKVNNLTQFDNSSPKKRHTVNKMGQLP